MSDYTPEDIVKYSLSGDGARAKEAIQGVLANKVMDSKGPDYQDCETDSRENYTGRFDG